MEQTTNKRRIYATLIVCIGVVISVWVYSKTPKNISLSKSINDLSKDVSVRPYIETDASESWKEILTNTEKLKEKPVILTNNDKTIFDDTTLTSQMSKDFMSEYLILKGSGKEITETDIVILTEKILSVPAYTKTPAPIYIEKNLKILSSPTKDSIDTYKKIMTIIIKNGLKQVKEDPYVIMANAIKLEIPNEMNKLDPIIVANKNVINDLLKTSVPKEAVSIHLSLLNSLSKTLSDLESIRVVFDDPVRSLSAIKQYPEDVTSLINSINIMGQYLLRK